MDSGRVLDQALFFPDAHALPFLLPLPYFCAGSLVPIAASGKLEAGSLESIMVGFVNRNIK
jgi:hypothetical protein